jgi:uncharacterized protein YjbJ (UPF0337 family)
MNRDTLKGKWHQLKGTVKEKWGELTDDDVDRVNGNAEHLIGVLQERYGFMKQRAEQEVDDFLARHSPATS